MTSVTAWIEAFSVYVHGHSQNENKSTSSKIAISIPDVCRFQGLLILVCQSCLIDSCPTLFLCLTMQDPVLQKWRYQAKQH